MTKVDVLTRLIEQGGEVDVRLALYREKHKDDWKVGYGEILVGTGDPARERTWTYSEDVFVERRLSGFLAVDLMRGKPQQVAGLTVSAEAVKDSGSFQRVAGQVRYNNAVLPWPRTEWQLNSAGQAPSRPRLHPLTVLAWVEDDRLHLRCESSPRFRAETVDRLLAEARARLTEVAAALRTPGAEPAATGESERTGLAARQLRRIHRALGDGPAR